MSDETDPFRRVKACSGTGSLTAGDAVLPCRFDAYQRGDAKIVIDCEGDDPSPMHEWPWDVQLAGTTAAGRQVESHGAHVVSSTFKIGKHGLNSKLRLIAAGLDIGVPAASPTLRYGLTNLEKFLGNEAHVYTTPDGRKGGRRRIRLLLGAFDVLIEHRPDAEAVLKELSLTRGVAVTAEATVTATPNQTAAADEVMRKLCHLLTLGQGSAVSWIYRDSVDEHGDVVATFCGNAVTKPYDSAHPLIADEDMCAFVQATFPAWDEAESRWEVRNASLGYTDAKIQVDYLESRALKMAVVIEHLKRVYLERAGREFVLPDAVFQEKVAELRSRVMKVLKELFSDQTAETLGYLVPGLQGLHRTSFKEALKGMAAELRLPLDKKETGLLVPVRDRLVHAMRFPKDVELSPIQQYHLLTTFAGRLILAALGYEGRYYDWTTLPPTLVKLSRLPEPEPPKP